MKKENYDYKKIPPFKWFVLQNFPFIEADFDAITNYQLLCKIVEYLNTTINSVNELGTTVESFTDFITNYFNNLDVQEEINNKLDDMVESGELQAIITQYLQVSGVLAYNTLNDLKNASNLIDGSIAMTFGKTTYNDGQGAFYKIRTITSGDTVDGENIVAVNFSNTLIAEKQHNKVIEDINSDISEINGRLNNEYFVFIGDSYGTPVTVDPNWVDKFNELAGLTDGVNSFNFCRGAAGFVSDGTNTYLNNLSNNINQIDHKEYVKHVIICGGWNDRGIVYGATDFTPIQTLCNYIKQQFPNAKIYCGMIANYKQINDVAGNIYWRDVVSSYLYKYYKEIENYGGAYLNGVENILHNYALFQNDYIHPNAQGYIELGRAIYGAWRQGTYFSNKLIKYQTINSTNYTLADNIANTTAVVNNVVWVNNRALIQINGRLNFTNDVTLTNNSLTFNIAQYTENQEMLRYVNQYSVLEGVARVIERKDEVADPQEYLVQCKFTYDRDGYIKATLTYSENLQGMVIKSVIFNFINDKDIINT